MINYIVPFGIFESRIEPGFDWYYGIADCHGLESFIKKPEDIDELDMLSAMGLGDTTGESQTKDFNRRLNMMKMRCHANQQRWPVVYMANLSEENAEMVQELFDAELFDLALEVVKHNSKEIKLARGIGGNLEKRWSMIPNHDLDSM